ncbi:MAG: bifunctional riboflavin kinase/FAD synthetase [Thermonemataceae bacterium]
MQIHHHIDRFPTLQHAIVTSGTFDGVHIGHQQILQRLKQLARQHQGETVVITFWPHPRIVLEQPVQLLSTLEEKADLLKQNGVDLLVVIPFTKEFAQMSPEDFVQKIYIEAIGTKKLVIGYDHHFGKNRAGNFDYLHERLGQYPFTIEEISRQDIDNIGVSSTKIRTSLLTGEITTAHQYLGRAYSFTGEVVHGNKIGRTLGFPTANIHVKEHYKLIPAEGIYAVYIQLATHTYQGMLYIGTRPTIENTLQQRIEVNIFDFEEDIYGKTATIVLFDYIRGDLKLDGLDALKKQLQEDRAATRALFASAKRDGLLKTS